MKNKNKISQLDKKHFIIIRNNVEFFLQKCGQKYDSKGLLLDIAPQDYQGAKPYFPQATVHTLDINPASAATYIADLCHNNHHLIPNNYYDFVVCTEVLEHTLNPFAAIKEIYRILKNKGLVFITVPFNFRIHGPQPDCWRFTFQGIKVLLSKFNIIDVQETETPNRWLMPIHYQITAQK